MKQLALSCLPRGGKQASKRTHAHGSDLHRCVCAICFVPFLPQRWRQGLTGSAANVLAAAEVMLCARGGCIDAYAQRTIREECDMHILDPSATPTRKLVGCAV